MVDPKERAMSLIRRTMSISLRSPGRTSREFEETIGCGASFRRCQDRQASGHGACARVTSAAVGSNSRDGKEPGKQAACEHVREQHRGHTHATTQRHAYAVQTPATDYRIIHVPLVIFEGMGR